MSRILPILFNTEMVQAILDDRKTVTRRLIKYSHHDIYGYACLHGMWYEGASITPEMINKYVSTRKMPYQPGDTLYVRETWAFQCCVDCMNACEDDSCMIGKASTIHEDKDTISEGCYIYRTDHPNPERITWHPSIHMPKAAARIWLKVKDVRVERLQEITADDIRNEGLTSAAVHVGDMEIALKEWEILWNSTLNKADIDKYSWAANPWVWVIEFERCEKPEEEK